MAHVKAVLLASALALLATGCTWVRVSDAGAAITVAATVPDPACRRVGSVSARTRATIAGMARDAARIEQELDDLARDEAVDLGADLIVPEGGEVAAGTRTYGAYVCSEASGA